MAMIRWIKSRSAKEKLLMGCMAGLLVCAACSRACVEHARGRGLTCATEAKPDASMQVLLILWKTVSDHDTLFILAELSHFLGIFVLGYKLYQKRSVTGVRVAILAERAASPCVSGSCTCRWAATEHMRLAQGCRWKARFSPLFS